MLTHLQAIEMAIITNAKSLKSSVSKAKLKRLFLAKSNYINGVRLQVIELSTSSYKEDFYQYLTDKNVVQLRSYWTRLIFTGKALPPKQFATKEELLKQMQEKKNIVTYLPTDEVPATMYILYTFLIEKH